MAVEALKDKRVVLISGGWRHTAVADDAGRLYTWGWNKVLHLTESPSDMIKMHKLFSGGRAAVSVCWQQHSQRCTCDFA